MTDETFPQAEPGDTDEVVLALKTAGSLWTSGEKTEAIRWLRKAQEHADEAGNDMRSLALARAAAELTDAAKQAEGANSKEPSATEDVKPQLTKPPMPPPNSKPRPEAAPAKSSNGRSTMADSVLSADAGEPSAAGATSEVEAGPILTQALRVCIKRSVRDDELLIARLLEDGEVPAGYQEALVVLTEPSQDLLDKLS